MSNLQMIIEASTGFSEKKQNNCDCG